MVLAKGVEKSRHCSVRSISCPSGFLIWSAMSLKFRATMAQEHPKNAATHACRRPRVDHRRSRRRVARSDDCCLAQKTENPRSGVHGLGVAVSTAAQYRIAFASASAARSSARRPQ